MANAWAALAMADSNEVFRGMFPSLLDWCEMIRGIDANSRINNTISRFAGRNQLFDFSIVEG
jgi:hypothetical protein